MAVLSDVVENNILTRLDVKDLLSDVVEKNILTRLDVKDLLRCKRVCKSWYSLISSPYFVKAHLKHNDVPHTRIAMPTYWKIPNHENLYQYNKWKLVGSSNGLVCVSIFPLRDALLLLINPWTRELRELPIPPLFLEEINNIANLSLSFGYDSSTDDYKLVMVTHKERMDASLVQVFSLKSMTWKHIGHIKYCLTHGGCGVLFNAALHWFADDYNTEKRRLVILSFDLSPEEFKVIPVPDDSRYVVMDSKLGVFEDNLCISCADGIWVMRNYNVKQSWEFLSNDYDMNSHDAIHYLKIYDS
ncbi:putative F-box domain containing protein, partial [Tanacetum coccineum]